MARETASRPGDAALIDEAASGGGVATAAVCPYVALAIGAPEESVGGVLSAGAVNVLYASPDSLSSAGDQLWHRNSQGIDGPLLAGAEFGDALVWGDFDGDGCPDLAIGAPPLGSDEFGAGEVNVLYGQPGGLAAEGDQLWRQSTQGVVGEPETGEQFGDALAAGDFDADGFDDLAVGVPFDVVAGLAAGAVNVLYGSEAGLSAQGDQRWHQGRPGVTDAPEDFDRFGVALAVGDFDGDGFADLAAGADQEEVNGDDEAGAVNVLYGSSSGLSAGGNQLWHQDSPGAAGASEPGDNFGHRLAAGDFDGDGRDDLAVSVVGEDVDGINGAGAVSVIYGCPGGLCATGDQLWHQDTPGVVEVGQANDDFGSALATGDFDGDGFDDLAVGIAGQDIGTLDEAGAVAVLFGSSNGLTSTSQLWTQAIPGVEGDAEEDAIFGFALSAADFDDDGRDDLAIGALTTVNGKGNAGSVNLLYGCSAGVCATGDQLWTQASAGVEGAAEASDFFGAALGGTAGN